MMADGIDLFIGRAIEGGHPIWTFGWRHGAALFGSETAVTGPPAAKLSRAASHGEIKGFLNE